VSTAQCFFAWKRSLLSISTPENRRLRHHWVLTSRLFFFHLKNGLGRAQEMPEASRAAHQATPGDLSPWGSILI
jgi:hypothetical protein